MSTIEIFQVFCPENSQRRQWGSLLERQCAPGAPGLHRSSQGPHPWGRGPWHSPHCSYPKRPSVCASTPRGVTKDSLRAPAPRKGKEHIPWREWRRLCLVCSDSVTENPRDVIPSLTSRLRYSVTQNSSLPLLCSRNGEHVRKREMPPKSQTTDSVGGKVGLGHSAEVRHEEALPL